MTTLDLTSDSVFDHVRSNDNELVGYIAVTDEGDFVPFDLLHRQAGPACQLAQAEELLDEIGLGLLAEVYELQRDGQRLRVGIKELTRNEVVVGPLPGDLDPSSDPVDLTARWSYSLPTPELTPLSR
ncbi:hypothetical protein M3G03_08510 [Aestuariimicrobium sp. p3-SID1156]|uniref:hypothetical protein n=1 Tax=Aestuariimicrobium sp. p3-SID1156 TaxID=2916038 RepID=UPI00223B1043|nr:hypothetical protein [Aestuariimicrobium sp. p3-SID1156]MCT1459577.1 hypothetical protein [Aestuariimicrobium sp. p3-SID1156]